MNDFIVSAIKYRPPTFHSVVGQASITETLKNAISQKRLAHAYLFCGPRGVGKTTCARIFAKTLNCINIQDSIEPCNECESCKAFNENRSFNIHELDAASNNKVDDIRQLIDQVRIPPQLGQYSIYIIDEVHMLTSQAFNAFLKTLEEPPKHAIFILATTEKHKIIPTILSRCQIFDFNRIRVEDIVRHLQYVASQENIEVEVDALNVIALKADGAMRDSLSIFDQIVSFSGHKLTYAKTIENLNVLDYDYYFQMVNAMLENRGMDALLLFNTILGNGFEAQYFLNGMATHLRDLLVSATPKTLVLLEVGESVKLRYQEQVRKCTADYLFQALDIINACDMGYRASRNKRLHVELALLKLCNLSKKKVETVDNSLLPEIKDQREVGQKTEQKEVIPKREEKIEEKKKEEVAEKVEDRKVHIPSVSIKSVNIKEEILPEKIEGEKQNLQTIEEEIFGEDVFTVEQARQVIVNYGENNNLDSRIKSVLNFYPPEVVAPVVFIKVSNSLEKELVEKHRVILERVLRKELNNKNILVQLKNTTEKDRSIKSMGDTDKLMYLIKKNKSVLKLKKELGLDFQ